MGIYFPDVLRVAAVAAVAVVVVVAVVAVVAAVVAFVVVAAGLVDGSDLVAVGELS